MFPYLDLRNLLLRILSNDNTNCQRGKNNGRLFPAYYDGDTLKLRQNKTDTVLSLPCTIALKAALDGAKADLGFAPHPSRHILTRPDGSAMSYHAMARVMISERKRLGLMAFDQHALRYRGVMELAWAGCTDDEIASYSGHSSKKMIIKYAGEARQIMRARQAAAKRK